MQGGDVVLGVKQRKADGLREDAKMAAAASYLNIKTIPSRWNKETNKQRNKQTNKQTNK